MFYIGFHHSYSLVQLLDLVLLAVSGTRGYLSLLDLVSVSFKITFQILYVPKLGTFGQFEFLFRSSLILGVVTVRADLLRVPLRNSSS